MAIKSLIPLCVLSVLAAGCATRASVEQDRITNSFTSSLQPTALARCMLKSIDGRFLGSLKGSLESIDPSAPEVIVRNGDHIWAVAKIQASAPGSRADILYGAAGKFDIEQSKKWFTEGCS
jgi:hypothetical protein